MSEIQTNFDLSNANTLAVPSIATQYLNVEAVADLQLARSYAANNGSKILILGEGSNLVLGSQIPALVLKIELSGKQIEPLDNDYSLVELAAGENWHSAVKWCLEQGLFGIENLALIPGSVGAAPVQNIGAYGVELSEILDRLEYFDIESGELCQITAAQCQFGYRTSRFKQDLQDRAVITRIWLRLKNADKSSEGRANYPVLTSYLADNGLLHSPKNIFAAVCSIRHSRLPDPGKLPNVGSFFHNPVIPARHYEELLKSHPELPGYEQGGEQIKVPAAWLIESLGWKGKEQFGVQVSDAHALVLTNPNHRDAESILEMADAIRASVAEQFDIQLTIEPRVYPQR